MENLEIKGNSVLVKVSKNVFQLAVIYSASYVYLDKYYIWLDEKDNKYEIQITPKNGNEDLNKLGREFHNYLVTYSDYAERSKKNSDLRNFIVGKALMISEEEIPKISEEIKNCEIFDDEEFEFDDPEGIAIPWEEKYGKKQS